MKEIDLTFVDGFHKIITEIIQETFQLFSILTIVVHGITIWVKPETVPETTNFKMW